MSKTSEDKAFLLHYLNDKIEPDIDKAKNHLRQAHHKYLFCLIEARIEAWEAGNPSVDSTVVENAYGLLQNIASGLVYDEGYLALHAPPVSEIFIAMVSYPCENEIEILSTGRTIDESIDSIDNLKGHVDNILESNQRIFLQKWELPGNDYTMNPDWDSDSDKFKEKLFKKADKAFP